MKRSIPEVEATVELLVNYFAKIPDGERLSWLRIEAETGVKMTEHGKELVRRALNKIDRIYMPTKGDGITYSSADNALDIVVGDVTKMANHARRSAKRQASLQVRHLEQMSPADQQKMLTAAGFFGALRTLAKSTTVKVLKG